MKHSDYGPIGLLVIQSTSLCNLDCSYCYLPDRQRRNVFNLQQQLPLLLERVYESPFWGPHLLANPGLSLQRSVKRDPDSCKALFGFSRKGPLDKVLLVVPVGAALEI